MRDPRLTVAEWLLESGAGRSAVLLLGDRLGQRANEIRRLASQTTLVGRTVYALVTTANGLGATVPLLPVPGRSRARDPDLRTACDRALESARAILGAPRLPALRFELEEWLELFGASLGLPATLAFLAYYAPSRAPAAAILATGRLSENSVIAAVDGLPAKLAIAEAERGDKLIITPESCSGSIEAAVAAVFGAEPMIAERHVLTLDQAIDRARNDPDRGRAIAELESLSPSTDSDRARLLLELGTLLRHSGASDRAARLHAEARSLLDAQRRFIGGDAAERYELECWLSAMDEFRIDEAIDALSQRLTAPFLSAHNEVRCRGMLAQALGMSCRHDEAVRARTANLALQESTDALRAVLPGTWCYLALDSARAGDAEAFERWCRLLVERTPLEQDHQWRFNHAAVVRGLVALGRDRAALDWVEARTALLMGSGEIETHPETSLLRAVCRAWRRLGEPERARELAERVPIRDEPNLVSWLGALVHLEARSRTAKVEVQVGLTRLHAAATAYYGLADAEEAVLDAALDRVWY